MLFESCRKRDDRESQRRTYISTHIYMDIYMYVICEQRHLYDFPSLLLHDAVLLLLRLFIRRFGSLCISALDLSIHQLTVCVSLALLHFLP